jgi:ankyrin repeat protein
MLLEHGADVHAARNVSVDCSMFTVQVQDGSTALFMAAQAGHYNIVDILIRHGARTDVSRADGATPLFKAAHKGHVDIVLLLLDNNAQLHILPVCP